MGVGAFVPVANSFIPTLASAILFFVVGIGVFALSWIVYRDWATPVNLFVIPWLFNLGLFHLQLLHESVLGTLEPFTYVIVVGSLFCFLVGSFVADYRTDRGRYDKTLRSTGEAVRHDWSPTRIRTVIFLSFLIGLAVWGYLFWRVGGLRTFLTEPKAYEHSLLLPVVDDLYRLLFLAGFLGVYYVSIGQTKHRHLIIMVCIASLILIGSRLARSDLFLYLMVSFLILHQIRRTRLRDVMAVLAVMLLAFVVIQYHRASQFDRELGLITSGIARAPQSMPWLAAFYPYTVTNIRNVQIAIGNTSAYEWGRNMFYPIWAFTRTARLMGFERHTHAYWRSIYGLGILKPSLIDFHRDFGVLGTTLLPALLGFFGTRLYRAATLEGRMYHVLLCALLSYCLLFSFVTNFFNDSAIWLFAGMFFVVDRLCRVRRQRCLEGNACLY